ncbi:MAG: DUF397 domain-containing protein [Acidimicrobiia bacterium]|nr:DUF397 domain-containing protein [Acidimicrobiia bacterium]
MPRLALLEQTRTLGWWQPSAVVVACRDANRYGRGGHGRASADGNCCVEVKIMGDQILVRDAMFGRQGEDRARQPTLVHTPAEWRAFLAGVKSGEFDL